MRFGPLGTLGALLGRIYLRAGGSPPTTADAYLDDFVEVPAVHRFIEVGPVGRLLEVPAVHRLAEVKR